jgi:hypothetical protein
MNPKGLALLLLTSAVFAGTTAIQKAGDWALKKQGDNTIISRHTTLDECVKAAPAGKYKCDTSVALDVTGTCDDKPTIPRTKDADGFNVQPPIRYKESTEGDLTDVEIQDYVPAPYPTCWVLGWRDAKVEDLAPPTADLPNTIEPFPFSPEDQKEWDARQVAEAAACAAGDVKQCPPGPPSLDTPCGKQFCGVGAGG